MNYCKVMVAGRLTRDPESKTTATGKTVATFSLAVNRKAGEREEVLFLDCEAWDRRAEVVAEYVKKGDPLFVEGRLRQDTWTGRDGARRSRLVLVAESVQFIGAKSSEARDAAPGAAREAADAQGEEAWA